MHRWVRSSLRLPPLPALPPLPPLPPLRSALVGAVGRRGALACAVACALVGVVLAGTGLWFAGVGPPGVRRPGTGEAQAPAGRAAPAPAASAGPSGDRLRVPAIGVDATVEPVGLDGAGNMATPSTPANVGWYRYGPAPGDPGDAVMDGHLDWTAGPAVFWRLGHLRPGDQIVVDLAGRGSRVFRVAGLTTVAYTAHPSGLFATSGTPRLSLITCTGPFDTFRRNYTQRLIVDATLVT